MASIHFFEVMANATGIKHQAPKAQVLATGLNSLGINNTSASKQALYEVITREFGEAREKFNYYMEHPEEVEAILVEGAKKAATTANETLSKVRTKLGY